MWVKNLPRVVYSIIFAVCISSDPFALGDEKEEDSIWSAPLIEINNRVYTRVTILGDEHLFLVDNGCGHTIIGSPLAGKLKFKPQQQITYVAAYNKGHDAELGKLESLLIGELELSNAVVRHSSMITTLSRRIKSKISGVIGYSSMKALKTTLNFREKCIYFSKSSKATEGGNVYPVERNAIPIASSNPWNLNQHIFAIEISLNGKETFAFIDLGYPGSVITTISPRELKLSPHMSMKRTSIEIFGYLGQARYTKAREIQVGKVHKKNVEVLYFKSSKIPQITILGVEFLKDFCVTFDFKNKAVVMDPYS